MDSAPGPWFVWDDNPNEWAWGRRARRRHDLHTWLPAPVPGSVHEALWRARRIPNPYRDLNSRAAEWVEHRDWVYGCDVVLAPPAADRRVFFEAGAIADRCRIFCNGAEIGAHEGPGAPIVVEVGPRLQEGPNQLLIVVQAPAPEEPQIGWTAHTRSLQGRMGYGWDFAPRLVRLGLLGPVRLRTTGAHRLHDLSVRAAPEESLGRARIDLAVRVDGPPGAQVRFTVRRGARVVATTEVAADGAGARATVEIPRPALWWPNGAGGQPLYEARAECLDGSDALATAFGIRRLRWITRPGAASDEWPFTLEVNGRRLFQHGWNWVPADALGGPRADRRATRLLRLARNAGANILRCWGGADPETPAFYAACDCLGLLVWQEFPLSSAGISNLPPADPAYLDRLGAYAQAVVAARRNHPSLALWGGGNELLGDDARPLTLAHPCAARLAAVVAAEDPDRAFRPSSPLGPHFDADPECRPLWDVHGPWEYGEQPPGPQYARLNALRPLLHSELGAPGEASLATQRAYLSAPYRGLASNPARRHHGGAWWDHQAVLARLFGPLPNVALAILASQWLQAETLRYYVEDTRRRWPDTAGIYPWQLDEPWPNVTCTSAVEYGGRPKLAYYAVRGAYRPRLATARYAALTLDPGAPLAVEIWLLADAPAGPVALAVTLQDPTGAPLHPSAHYQVAAPAPGPVHVTTLAWPLPPGFAGLAVLDLALPGARNRYLFSAAPAPPLQAALAAPDLLRTMFL